DLIATRPAHEWVVRWHGVGAAVDGAGIDAQQLAQQALGVLGVIGRVAARAAIPRAEVEQVTEELQLAAIVIGIYRVPDLDHAAPRAPCGPCRVAILKFIDAEFAPPIGVVSVEALALLVVGREGDREQATLTAVVANEAADVEKGLSQLAPIPD